MHRGPFVGVYISAREPGETTSRDKSRSELLQLELDAATGQALVTSGVSNPPLVLNSSSIATFKKKAIQYYIPYTNTLTALFTGSPSTLGNGGDGLCSEHPVARNLTSTRPSQRVAPRSQLKMQDSLESYALFRLTLPR